MDAITTGGRLHVSLATQELKDGKLICVIERVVAPIGTADIADYCFAVAVDRGMVKQVEVWVGKKGAGKPRETLSIGGK